MSQQPEEGERHGRNANPGSGHGYRHACDAGPERRGEPAPDHFHGGQMGVGGGVGKGDFPGDGQQVSRGRPAEQRFDADDGGVGGLPLGERQDHRRSGQQGLDGQVWYQQRTLPQVTSLGLGEQESRIAGGRQPDGQGESGHHLTQSRPAGQRPQEVHGQDGGVSG